MIRFVLLMAAAAIVGASESHRVSESGRGAYEASLAVSGSLRAVAWYDTGEGHPDIYFRLLDVEGRPAGFEHRVTTGPDFAYEPDLAIVAGRVAMAWYEKNAATGRLPAKLGVFIRDGRQIAERALSGPGRDGRNPVLRAVGERLFCAWIEKAEGAAATVWAAWFDANGQAVVPGRAVAPAGETTWNLTAAVDRRNEVWLAFDARLDTRAEELFLAHVEAGAAGVRRITSDDGFASKYPDVAFSGDRMALTWFDERDGNEEVYLRAAGPDEPLDTVEQRARRVTNTTGESIGAYLAWNGRTIGLAWCDNTYGQHEVYFARFDASGRPLSETQRLTETPAESLIPAIRSWQNGFALVWNEFQPAPGGAHDPNGRSEVMFRALR